MLKALIAILVAIVAAVPVTTNSSATTTKCAEHDSVKTILFIGNSLTFYHNLPTLVEQVGADSGIQIKTETLAFPDYGLEDHWNDGKIQQRIKDKHFDFVVVQQGPSSQAEGRDMLLNYGAKIKALCDSNNAKLAFYMVWPAFANLDNFDGVIRNYRDAATTTHSILCPVGEVWKKHFDDTKDYSYYWPDMFHPSPAGSLVAAQVIFHSLFR